MEHIVTGCKDCPMFDNGADYEYECSCLHPKAPRQFSEYGDSDELIDAIQQIEVEEDWSKKQHHIPVTPEWCPLNTEPITIIKKQ